MIIVRTEESCGEYAKWMQLQLPWSQKRNLRTTSEPRRHAQVEARTIYALHWWRYMRVRHRLDVIAQLRHLVTR